MRPSFTVPPVPQAFCISLASDSFSGRPIPLKFATTVTVLPPRCAVWRMISTRPRFFGRCSLLLMRQSIFPGDCVHQKFGHSCCSETVPLMKPLGNIEHRQHARAWGRNRVAVGDVGPVFPA